jgi:hypothetical protein
MAGPQRTNFRIAPATCIVAVIAVLGTFFVELQAQEAAPPSSGKPDKRLEDLEQMIRRMSGELKQLRAERQEDRLNQQKTQITIDKIQEDAAAMQGSNWMAMGEQLKNFSFGGYGEMHANFGENGSSDQFDIHRLVMYIGYDFTDWIKFHSEVEIEHAFVADDSGGEVVIEQAYMDFELNKAYNIRAGRVLTPLGIVNQKHEPTSFLGVERPLFAKYIIPSTWSSDGVGVYGSPCKWLDYQVYIVAGLDGAGFSDTGGIRGGRIKERPSYHEPAITGRVDVHPFAGIELPHNQDLRVGFSGYFGGLDNGNKGKNPGINGDISIYSADFEYSISKFDFRGAAAYEYISNASSLNNGTAEGIFGWYIEGGYHFMPESWKTGKLADSDAVAFVRYDEVNTQFKMPDGVSRNPAGRQNQWTFGVNFYPVKNVVVKVDYQVRSNGNDDDMDDLINFGLGWEF